MSNSAFFSPSSLVKPVGSRQFPAAADNQGRAVMGKVVVKAAGRVVALEECQIDWLEASHNYVLFHCGAASYTVRGTLDALARQLSRAQFLQVHRSAIVNLDRVSAVDRSSPTRLVLVLASGRHVPVSRSRAKQVAAAVRGLKADSHPPLAPRTTVT